MGKHYELKEDKARFLIELWHREHGLKIDELIMCHPDEATRYLREWVKCTQCQGQIEIQIKR